MKNISLLIFILSFVSLRCKKTEELQSCPMDRPCLISPHNHQQDVSLNAVFKWRVFENYDTYQLQVCVNEDFHDSPYAFNPDSILQDTQYTAIGVRHVGATTYYLKFASYINYYWRVRGIGADTSLWSDTYTFKTLSIRDSVLGVYTTEEFRWSIDYPDPYTVVPTYNTYSITITPGNGPMDIVMNIPGVLIDTFRSSGSYEFEPVHNSYDNVYFIPELDSIMVFRETWGYDPPWHLGGEYYNGSR